MWTFEEVLNIFLDHPEFNSEKWEWMRSQGFSPQEAANRIADGLERLVIPPTESEESRGLREGKYNQRIEANLGYR